MCFHNLLYTQTISLSITKQSLFSISSNVIARSDENQQRGDPHDDCFALIALRKLNTQKKNSNKEGSKQAIGEDLFSKNFIDKNMFIYNFLSISNQYASHICSISTSNNHCEKLSTILFSQPSSALFHNILRHDIVVSISYFFLFFFLVSYYSILTHFSFSSYPLPLE